MDRVKVCKRCRKLFDSYRDYCYDCMDEVDANFEILRNYIYDHPGVRIGAVSNATKIPESDILYLVKEGRLILAEPDPSVRCEHCGKPVASGRICEACKEDFTKVMSNMITRDDAENARKAVSQGGGGNFSRVVSKRND